MSRHLPGWVRLGEEKQGRGLGEGEVGRGWLEKAFIRDTVRITLGFA